MLLYSPVRVHVGTGLVVERPVTASPRSVKLRDDLFLSFVGLLDEKTDERLGILVAAFTSDTKYRHKLDLDEYYSEGHHPDLTKLNLTVAEQETVDKAAREFAPLCPLWKE